MTGLEKYGEWLSSTEHPPEAGGHELKVTGYHDGLFSSSHVQMHR